MTKSRTPEKTAESSGAPLIFISHDSRDAALAEAFSDLIKKVSAGMLKTFRSSDKKGTEGIEFGDEWYKRLMEKLEVASDVVCLLTERSLGRPWLLYEAGVAKGKMNTPVHGIALGVSLNKVSDGPFYQFQNSDDSEDSLSKLMLQLCERVSGLEPDKNVVKNQVQEFKNKAEKALKANNKPDKKATDQESEEVAIAKVLEEMKLMVRDLPRRLERLSVPDRSRSRRMRRFHPMMIEEMLHTVARGPDDPIIILFTASLVREDFPWLYEIGAEAYRAARIGNAREAHGLLESFRHALHMTIRGPLMEEMGVSTKEMHMVFSELEMIIEHHLEHFKFNEPKKAVSRKSKVEPK